MELGNLFFGCSRGEFPVDRSHQKEFVRLFEVMGCDSYGTNFENDIFSVMPYWWDDCTCGWEEYEPDLEHSSDCFMHEYAKLGFLDKDGFKALKILYKKNGWNTKGKEWWRGCALRCTCDLEERYAIALEEAIKIFGHHGHKPDCKLVLPNFRHNPSGLEIQWYKYPLRDSYSNQQFTAKELSKIIDECILSLAEKK